MSNPPTPPGGQNQKDIAQGVRDLSSGLASALKSLGFQDTQLISAFGALFAAVVSFTALGFVGAVAGLVVTIVSLFSKAGPDEVQQLGQALRDLIAKFEQAEAAKALDEWLQKIQDQVGNAQGVEASIPSWANQPPLPPPDVTNNLQKVVSVLAALAPPDVSGYGASYAGYQSLGAYWMVPYNYQVYWDDSDSPDVDWPWPPYYLPVQTEQYGYHKQAPPLTNSVFYYTYVLPAYLYAASVFLSAGAVIDPKFKENWSDVVLRPTASFLQSVHDYIVNSGFTQLSPAPFTGESLTALLTTYVEDAQQGVGLPLVVVLRGAQQGILPSFNWNGPGGGGAVSTPGLEIEYGYVEKFSGYSSVGIYTMLTGSIDVSFASGPNYYGKFQIRLRKRMKDVYVSTGMSAVWNAINNLKTIVGDAPLPGPSIADWSVRRDLAPFANVTAADGSVRLRAIHQFLSITQPTDFKQDPNNSSFRLALNV